MAQLYFLSIVFNGLIGFLLVFGDITEGASTAKGVNLFFSSWGGRLVIGILATVTGILKLLLPMARPLILGDTLPALAGVVAGFILIFGFYRENSVKRDDAGNLDRIGDMFLHYKKLVGIVLLAVAVLHFLFPTALFL